jgi:CPA2 family monovalent cation:H+ antiporter-2
VDASSAAVGQSLAELNLRGRSGATVLAISRDGESIVVPTADERLKAGDVLAITGSHDAIEAAKALLR